MLKPISTSTRELIRLDGLWRFALDDVATPEPWAGDLETALEAPVPASYNDVFADQAIRDHVGWVWYQRTVRVPRGWAGERVVLRVDAATHEGVVYVDGTKVAEHVGGYTPFEADVTDLVRVGEAVRITIGVNNELTNETIPPGMISTTAAGRRKQSYRHDFYNYAGLARSVILYSVPATRVTDVTVTTNLDGSTGVVDYRVEASGGAEVRVVLSDAARREVATADGASGRITVDDANRGAPAAAICTSCGWKRFKARASPTSTSCRSASVPSASKALGSSSTGSPSPSVVSASTKTARSAAAGSTTSSWCTTSPSWSGSARTRSGHRIIRTPRSSWTTPTVTGSS